MNQASSRKSDRVRLGQFTDAATDTVAPTIPDDLRALSDEDLGALHDELSAFYAQEDAAADSAEALAALDSIVDAIVQCREIAAERIAGPGDLAAARAERAARLAVADPPAAPAADPVADPAPAPVVAAAPPADPAPAPAPDPAPVVAALPPLPGTDPTAPRVRVEDVLSARRQRRAAARAATPSPAILDTTITAAGEVPNWTSGQEMPDLGAVARAMVAKREAIGQPGANCGSDKITVASVHAAYPEDRHLYEGDNWNANQDKIDGARDEALVASGGLCAPVAPYYEIMTIAEAARPVRDGLATFQADRGGIRLIPPPQLVDAAGAIGFVTAAVDLAALGGNAGQISAATKPCIHVTCPGVTEYDIAAVTRCLEFGNITSRAYPEQVTAWLTLATAQHARKAETALIDVIAAHSTQVTLAKVVGAARDVISGIIKAAAYYRNHNRTLADRPLRCMMPAWVIDLMMADMTHGSGYEAEFFAMARQEIDDALSELDINVTYYLDTGTGKGQLINSGSVQTAGALTTFPSTVVWYLFSEGSFLFLDGGTLDFGIVRDSTLNALNNYRIFAETFETAAFVGVESLEGTQTVVADGTAAGVAYGLGAAQALPSSY